MQEQLKQKLYFTKQSQIWQPPGQPYLKGLHLVICGLNELRFTIKSEDISLALIKMNKWQISMS